MPTFDASKPASAQSPALFPAQNRANMDVLFANVSADHQFAVTTPSATAGYHKVIHWVTQSSAPVAIAGVGQLYTFVENGVASLYYRSPSPNSQTVRLSPQKLADYAARDVASSSYTAGQTKTVYNPGNDFTALIWATIPRTGQYGLYSAISMNGGASTACVRLAGGAQPTVQVSTTNITIQNTLGTTETILHSIISNLTPP